ncbi:heterokaryon incompatibility protein-domain-containing protein, partial [Clohesyomyces aquaticus]
MIGATEDGYSWRPALEDAASHIRLLHLPAATSQSNEIRVSLTTFPLKDAPKFQALSYCWRSPFPDEHPETPSYHEAESGQWTINCNNYKVNSTRNLYEALQKLAILCPDSYLWNDVTCINQQDLDEVNVQVAMMGQIYAAASRVIIWLGK